MSKMFVVILKALVAFCCGIAAALAPKAAPQARAEKRWAKTHAAKSSSGINVIAGLTIAAIVLLPLALIMGGTTPLIMGTTDYKSEITRIKRAMADNTAKIMAVEEKLEKSILTVAEKRKLQKQLAGLRGYATRLRRELAAAKDMADAERRENAMLMACYKADQRAAEQAAAQAKKAAERNARIELRKAHEAEQQALSDVFAQLPISIEEEQALAAIRKEKAEEKAISTMEAKVAKVAEEDGLTEDEKELLEQLVEIIGSDTDMLDSGLIEQAAPDTSIAAKMRDAIVRVIKRGTRQEYYSMVETTVSGMFPEKLVAAAMSSKAPQRIEALRDMISWVKSSETLSVIRRSNKVDTTGWSQGAARIGIKPRKLTDKQTPVDFNIDLPRINDLDDADAAVLSALTVQLKFALIKSLFLNGFKVGSRTYKFGYISNSGLKKGKAYFFRADVDMSPFMLGLTAKDFNAHGGILATKQMQLVARFFTPGMPSDRWTADGKMLRVSDAWVMPSPSIEKRGDITRCTPDTTNGKVVVQDEDNAIVKDKPFDGQGLIKWGVLKLKKLLGQVAQVRPFKGMIASIHMDDEDLKAVPSAFKGDPAHNDVREYKMFLDATMVKEVAFFETHEQWVKAYQDAGLDEVWFHDVGHEPEVKQRRLSRQMLQTIFDVGLQDLIDIAGISIADLAYINSPEGIDDLIKEEDRAFARKSELGKVASEIDGISKTSQFIEHASKKFYGELMDTLAGKPHVRGAYLFAISDPLAQYQMSILGMSYSETIGALKAGQCSTATFGPGKKVLERSPHINEEAVILDNIGEMFHLYGVVVVNIHDMSARIMALDFDGDHVIVIDNEKLVEIIERTKAKYGIRPVIFEPLESKASTTVPANAEAYAEWLVDMVMTCERFNLVGAYSKKANALWNSFRPGMTVEEVKELLIKAAKVACYVNWAVDSSKTYSMMYMESDLAEELDHGIYSDRYMYFRKDEFAELMSGDCSAERKAELLKKVDALFGESAAQGNGTVDRMIALVKTALKGRMRVNVQPEYEFNWTQLRPVDRLAVGVKRKPVEITSTLGKLLAKYLTIKGESGDKLAKMVASGEGINAYELFKALVLTEQTLLTEWCSSEVHDHDTYETNKKRAMTQQQLNDVLLDIAAEWVEPSSDARAEEAKNWSRNDKLTVFSWSLICAIGDRRTGGFKAGEFMVTRMMQLFGPYYRANYRMNVANDISRRTGKSVLEALSDKYGAAEELDEDDFVDFDD